MTGFRNAEVLDGGRIGPGVKLWPIALVSFCAGGLYGWSALIAPLQAMFGVSTARTGLVFSLAIVSFTVAVIASPRIAVYAHPARRIAGFGAAAAISLVMASLAPGYGTFVMFFSIGFGGLSGAIYVGAVSAAAGSPAHRHATPIMVAAFGLGGSVFGPLWRGLAAAGAGLWALWPLVAGMLIASAVTWMTAGRSRAGNIRAPGTTEHSAMAMTPRAFVLIWSIFAFGSFGGLMVLGLAAKMLDAAGATVMLSGAAIAGVAVGNTCGRLSVAGITMVASPLGAAFTSVGIGLIGLATTVTAGGPVALASGVGIVAMGYGVMASAVPALVRAHVGPARFAQTFARIFTAWGVAGFCAPLVAGGLFDARNSFDAALWLAIGATITSGAAALRLWSIGRSV